MCSRRRCLARGVPWLAALAFGSGCANRADPEAARAKIAFDLEAIGPDGLIGPPDGRRAVDYEFCIPAQPDRLADVQRIDPSVVVWPGSRGRIGCGPDQWLCLGNTHQPQAKQVLLRLARLPYISRIAQNVWE